MLDLCGAQPRHREPERGALEHHPDVVDLADLVRRQGAHGGAPVRLIRNETFGLELTQRLPHRDMTHLEAVRNLVLRQRLIGPEHTGGDRLAEHGGDQLVRGLFAEPGHAGKELLELQGRSGGKWVILAPEYIIY